MSKGKNQAPSGAIKHNTYTGKELTGYLVGLAGQNIIYNIIAGGLQYYWQSIIFLPAMAISVIFFVARVWDAINDPMMGSIVDHTRTKWGKCKPYLMFVPIPIGIITILTFCNKTYTDYTSTGAHVLIIAWAAISYILWGMCYTVGDIPLWGVTSLMTDDENDRAKALSLARIVANLGAIGMLITFAGKALSPMFQEKKGLDLIHADKMSYHNRRYPYDIRNCSLPVFRLLCKRESSAVRKEVHHEGELQNRDLQRSVQKAPPLGHSQKPHHASLDRRSVARYVLLLRQ